MGARLFCRLPKCHVRARCPVSIRGKYPALPQSLQGAHETHEGRRERCLFRGVLSVRLADIEDVGPAKTESR